MENDATTRNSDIENLHQKFAEYGANAKEWMKKCVLLLPEINKLRIWEKKGFGSIYEYAAKLSGMNRAKVNNSLRILEKIADKPALQKVVEKKGLNAVTPIVTIADVDNQKFWAEKAMQLTKNELETYVRDFKNGRIENSQSSCQESSLLQIGGFPRKSGNGAENAGLFKENDKTISASLNVTASIDSPTPTKKILMELSPETASKLEKLKGDSDWETLMTEFVNAREEKIEQTKPETKESSSRHVPSKIKRFVLAKYNGRCAFPSCNRPYSELHHAERFFFDNKHDPDTIIPLCASHHSLAHKGLIAEDDVKVSEFKIRFEKDLSLVDRMVASHKR